MIKKAFYIFSSILFYGSGVVMFIFWFVALNSWLGFLGNIIAVVVAPGLIIFPFIYWIVEGYFPVLYFLIYGIAIISQLIRAFTHSD